MTNETMNQASTFPYSPDVYFGQHPEKFEKRRQPMRIAKNVAFVAGGIFLLLFPGLIPFFPLWMIYLAAVVAIGFGAISIWTDGSAWFNLQSGSEVKDIGLKKFRNSRDEKVWDRIVKAFETHDFQYLAEAPSAKNQPLQLYVYEDKTGREFYLQMKGYNEKNEFEPLSDVITICGKEYDANADLLRSMKTDDED